MIAAKRTVALAAALTCSLILPPAASADFGLVPGSVTVTARNVDGTIDTRAGSHPDSLTVHFDLKTDESGDTEGGEMRNALVDLPPGLVGNPQAAPRCAQPTFEIQRCPTSSQVGVLHAILPGFGELHGPLYNVAPPPGVATQLGFSSLGFLSRQFASVRSEEGYGLRVAAINTPLPISSVTETVWGAPAATSHDPERFCGATEGCPSDALLRSYLTLPALCESAPETTISVDSVEDPRPTAPKRSRR